MKKLIYLVLLIALTAISCGVTSTLPTAAPRPLIDMEALYPAAPTMPQTATNWLVCHSGGLNVRIGAGTAFDIVGVPLFDGTQVVIISPAPVNTVDGSAWVEVATAENGGIVGWVNFRYLCEVKK